MSYSHRHFGTVALLLLHACLVPCAVGGESTQAASTRSDQEAGSEEVAADPILVIKISEKLLTDLLREPIREQSQVNTYVLNKPVDGSAFTYGRLYIDCVPSHDQARFWLLFAGRTTSRTVSHSDPAHIHSHTLTRFVTGKECTYSTIDQVQFDPAQIVADTHRTTLGIHSTLPGLRGHIVRKVARKRLAESSPAISRETDRQSRLRVQTSFDRHVQQRLGGFLDRLALIAPRVERSVQRGGYVWNVASTEHDIVLAASEPTTDGSPTSRSLKDLSLPTTSRTDALVEVWQHNRFDATDPQSMQRSFEIIQFVLRVLANSESVPQEYQENLRRLGEIQSGVEKQSPWSVMQLYEGE